MKKNKAPLRLVARRAPGAPTRGILQAGSLRLRCALGRAGTTAFKREGDGATPVAAMAILSAMLAPSRRQRRLPRLPTSFTTPRSGWCDAPNHPAYNRPVRLPFPASAETLRRGDGLYDTVVVLDWNVRGRVRGRGSAIFLHVARPGYLPTEGCVAVSRRDMERLRPLLRTGGSLTVQR